MEDAEDAPSEPESVKSPPSLLKTSEIKTEVSFLRQAIQKIQKLIASRPSNTLEESVAELIEEHDPEQQPLGLEEREMLRNILGFHELTVKDVMIPRTDIVAIEDTLTLEEIKQVVLEKEHTRMPVYHELLDNIIGFIHIKDLIPYLSLDKPFSIPKILRKVIFVPPSMPLIDLLAKFRSARVHMALVADEYGGTDGLVTIEDLIETIVGEIRDEHDTLEEADMVAIDEHTLDASARVHVETLEECLGIKLLDPEEEDVETIGGLILSLVGKVPVKGERIQHPSGIEFEITDADARRVQRVMVHHRQL